MAMTVDATTQESTSAKRYKLTFWRTIRSEWIKLFTLRSTWWILLVTILGNIGLCAGLTLLMSTSMDMLASDYGRAQLEQAGAGDLDFSQPGAMGMLTEFIAQSCSMLGQLVFVILAVLTITNEFSSGMIRSTMTVAPRRARVLTAKAVVIALVCAVVFAVSLTGGWAVGYAVLHDVSAFDVTLTSATSLRIMGGLILEMILLAWFGLGLGAIIRSSAGAIGAALGIMLVLPMIFGLISSATLGTEPSGVLKWLLDAQAFLPTNAGTMITRAATGPADILGPWEGLGVLGIWTLVVCVVAYVMTTRRDV